MPTAEVAAFLQEKGKEAPAAVAAKQDELKNELSKLDDGASFEVKEAKMKLAKNAEEKQVKIAAIKCYFEGVLRDELKGQSWGQIEGKLREEIQPKLEAVPEAAREKALNTALGKVQEKHDAQVDKFIDEQEEKMLANA